MKPICWHCGKHFAYWKNKPVFTVYIDPIGNAHKLHKICAKYGEYNKPVTAQLKEI
jgi:hypothetical protein